MSYYSALQAAWATSSASAAALPSGVTGTSLFGLTTAQKIAAVNGWTVANPQPAMLQPTEVVNAIASADMLTLTATQLQIIALILQTGGGLVDASSGSNNRAVFQSIFASKPTTLANLSALVSPFDNATQLWVTHNGYPLLSADTGNAGLS
jgi:hypothetical protein